MNSSTIVWVLAFTVLGPVPEHNSFAKYKSKQECMEAMEQAKQLYEAKKKHIVASCTILFK